MPEIIKEFRDEYSWMSNFAPYSFNDGRRTWPTVEHYFQACKTDKYSDFKLIVNAGTPAIAKSLGRKARLRKDWNEVKFDVMLNAIRMKLEQNKELIDKLLLTGKAEIIEGNYWHDNYWGDCYCPKCKHIPGENFNGKIFMLLRSEYQESIEEENYG